MLDTDNVFFVTHAKQLRKLNRSISDGAKR